MLRISIWKMTYSDSINLKKKIKTKAKEHVHSIDFYLITLNKCITLEHDLLTGTCSSHRNVEALMVLMSLQ